MVWDSESGARQFVEKHTLPFPVGRDASASIGTPYKVEATPTSLFIDRQGILVHRNVGELDKAEFERRIEQLLAR